MIGHYRKKPVVISAVYLSPDTETVGETEISPNDASVVAAAGWMLGYGFHNFKVSERDENGALGYIIATMEGDMHAPAGWWIIRGVKGEFYPCAGEIFEATYEEVEADD